MRNLTILLLALVLSPVARAAGLLAPTDETLPPLRITDHLVDVTVRDGIAVTDVTQTFHNDTGQRLEATYVFPLSAEADLTDFQMTFNGKMVKGRVLPAEEAARIYESIVRQSKDPGLIEFIGHRLLQMRVFPIEPGSDTTIKVQYQQVCRPIGGMMGYHYPLRTSKSAGQAYGTVRFAVSMDSRTALKSIWSPSHAVEIVRDGENKAKIAYEANGGSLDEDFLLLYGTDESDLGLSVVAYRPGDESPGHFALMLTPKQLWPDEQAQPQDVVFVLDTSGSMAGEKIEQAKAAMRFCVDQLDDGDRFTVVRFSTGYDVLGSELRDVTPESRKEAKAWIEGFSAGGGTNISDTLDHVLGMKPATKGDGADRPFVVIFLTDGQGNRTPDEIMRRLASSREPGDQVRVFPFGVGHDVNTILLDRLAIDFTGRPTYVGPGENLELVLSDFFSIVSRPVLSNLKLTLPEIGATERFPASLGDLYHGQQLIVAGQYRDATQGPVTLSAVRNGKRVEYVWPGVSFASSDSADYVPRLWAGRKIGYLIDQIREHGETSEMVAEIVALSQEYGIQTPYTSWLVDPERLPQLVDGGGLMPRRSANRVVQLRRLHSFGVTPSEPGAHADDLFLADGALALEDAEAAVGQSAGRAATTIARLNTAMKSASTMDRSRAAGERMITQKVGGKWYNRIDGYLVDEAVDDDAEITVIDFGSDAYFELIRTRPDLRAALAASRFLVVIVADGQAVMVAEDGGIDEFSDEQREQLGMEAGSD